MLAILVVADRCQQPSVAAEPSQILGDIAADTTGRGAHLARVGVAKQQVVVASAANIHIGTADHHHVRAFSQYITSALHISLPDQA